MRKNRSILKFVSFFGLNLCLGFIYILFVGYTSDISTNAVQNKSLNQSIILTDSIIGGADNPYMMPYYTGEILPTPQKVEYKNEYLSLANTAIILNNVEQNDPRLKYLLERIARYGGKYKLVTEANAEHT